MNTCVSIVRLDKHRNWVAGEEMRYREADGPANNQREDNVNNDLEFSNSKDVFVHDQNR
jgi:hypothetical protein